MEEAEKLNKLTGLVKVVLGGDEVFGFGAGGVGIVRGCQGNELEYGGETGMAGEEGGKKEDSEGLVERNVEGESF